MKMISGQRGELSTSRWSAAVKKAAHRREVTERLIWIMRLMNMPQALRPGRTNEWPGGNKWLILNVFVDRPRPSVLPKLSFPCEESLMNKVVAISKPARTGPPPDLAAEERALWVHLQAEYDLQDAGAIVLLGLLCRNLQLSRECRETVAAQGKVTQTGREHPLLKVQRDADKQATIALKALNLDLEPLRSGPGRPAGR